MAPLPALLHVEQLEQAGIFYSTRGQGVGAHRARRRCPVPYEDKEGRVWDSGCVTAWGQRTWMRNWINAQRERKLVLAKDSKALRLS